MYESYIKEIPIVDIDEEESEYSIIKNIIESQKRLELAHKNFEYARGDLIDYYIYQIKSEQAKISYLLRQAKDKKIIMELKKKKIGSRKK